MLKLLVRALATVAAFMLINAVARAQPAPATTPAPASSELTRRADDVVRTFRGQADLPTVFAPAFLAQVTPSHIATISQQLAAANGAVQRIEGIEPSGPHSATIRVGFERAVLAMTISLEPQAPHRIIGLLVTASEPRAGDSPAALLQELRALPGQVSFAIARLGDGGPTAVAAHQSDRPLAIGSAFKLIILAELSRQVQAGERRWSDVVPLARHSLPSGVLQDWPVGTPLTLQTIASLMISISDNTATDLALQLVGRERVEAMMATMGLRSAARNRPFLSTIELFSLKLGPPALLAQWQSGDELARRRMLAGSVAAVDRATLDIARFGGAPRAIDSVEWFASADDLVRVMDWLRRNGDDTARSILAINSGVGLGIASQFGYFGFKGGSEPGVLNLTMLVRNRAGIWHVVTGSWNNPAAPLEEARFLGLLSRAVVLVR